ncbi:MAG: hypothetical protein RBU25_18435 [Lentisphaeria bacterium]|jgi:hypothetical protein|nr:hypothetical protein [Lentisphaeria bacterium]
MGGDERTYFTLPRTTANNIVPPSRMAYLQIARFPKRAFQNISARGLPMTMYALKIHIEGKIEGGSLSISNKETGLSHVWEFDFFSDPNPWTERKDLRGLLKKGFRHALKEVRPGRFHFFLVNAVIEMPSTWSHLDNGLMVDVAKSFHSSGQIGALLFLVDGKLYLNGGLEMKSLRLPIRRYMLESPLSSLLETSDGFYWKPII